MLSRAISFGLMLFTFVVAGGCSVTPPANTGFLSNYDNLKDVGEEKMRYVSPKLATYSTFIIDSVVIKANESTEKLTPEQQTQVISYFEVSLANALTKGGYTLTTQAGPGVARIRIAITDIKQAEWWLNIHPATKITGVGKGGAAMEGEIVDSVSGDQLGAVIQGGKGGQFDLNPFSTIDDVKATIDQWTDAAVKRLDELKKGDAAA